MKAIWEAMKSTLENVGKKECRIETSGHLS